MRSSTGVVGSSVGSVPAVQVVLASYTLEEEAERTGHKLEGLGLNLLVRHDCDCLFELWVGCARAMAGVRRADGDEVEVGWFDCVALSRRLSGSALSGLAALVARASSCATSKQL